jgi:predicted transcriptional regulator
VDFTDQSLFPEDEDPATHAPATADEPIAADPTTPGVVELATAACPTTRVTEAVHTRLSAYAAAKALSRSSVVRDAILEAVKAPDISALQSAAGVAPKGARRHGVRCTLTDQDAQAFAELRRATGLSQQALLAAVVETYLKGFRVPSTAPSERPAFTESVTVQFDVETLDRLDALRAESRRSRSSHIREFVLSGLRAEQRAS